MASSVDPFRILGIKKDATIDEIKRAYRSKAAKYHPDAGGDAWIFQQVQEAYERITQQRENSKDPSEPKKPAREPSKPAREKVEAPEAKPLTQRKSFREFAMGQLPLQTETNLFILFNVIDVFVTYVLLRLGGVEANPIANFFLARWNIRGLVYFKMAMVAFVCVLAQVIARHNLARAKQLLIAGTIIVVAVVIYSLFLLGSRF